MDRWHPIQCHADGMFRYPKDHGVGRTDAQISQGGGGHFGDRKLSLREECLEDAEVQGGIGLPP